MVFNKLSKLSNYLSNGFLMDDIVSLLKKDKEDLSDEDYNLLTETKKYVKLIKDGFKLFSNGESISNVEESLSAYNSSIKALEIESERKFNEEEFKGIIESTEKEIEDILEEKKVEMAKSKIALYFFKSVAKFFLDQGNKIIDKEKEFFKM